MLDMEDEVAQISELTMFDDEDDKNRIHMDLDFAHTANIWHVKFTVKIGVNIIPCTLLVISGCFTYMPAMEVIKAVNTC